MTQRNGGTKSPPKRKRAETRKRVKFCFTLDHNKRLERGMAEWLTSLKDGRYLPTLRAALRLFCDLRAGRLEVFYELFPHLVQEIQARKASDEFNTIIEQLAQLRAQGVLTGAVGQALIAGDKFEDVVIEVTDAPGNRASADEVAYNMAMDMGDLFGD